MHITEQRAKPSDYIGLKMPGSVVPIGDDAREVSASMMQEAGTF
jgi:hypothetical protein